MSGAEAGEKLEITSKAYLSEPFAYLREEEDVSILVDNIMANTKGNDKMGGDQFWEDGPKMLLISIFDYVWYECPKANVTGPACSSSWIWSR